MAQVKEHVHTYVRWQRKFGEMQYKCDDPDCLHFAPISLILGKRSMCSICHENEIILTRKDFRLARPRCVKCSQTKEAKNVRKVQELVENLIGNEENN
jgi:hypothetical protein